eukprot:s6610_g3.t1
MKDLQLSEDQQKELASAEEQADLMRSMMAQSHPSAALGVVAQALASQKSSPGQTTEAMEDTAREGKRGNRNEEEEPTRGQESKGAQKWHRGDKKGGYGDGWSGHNKSSGHQAYQAKDRRQDKAQEENAWGMSEATEGVFALTGCASCPGDAQLGARPLPGVTDVAQSKPETINLPLRTMMLQHVLDILINRLEACTATEKSIEDAQKMLVLGEHHNVPYLDWNAAEKKLQIKKDREALPLDEARRILTELKRLTLLPLVVMRFHSTRKMVKEHKGEVLPMMLQIGHRTTEAQRTWEHLSRLAHIFLKACPSHRCTKSAYRP